MTVKEREVLSTLCVSSSPPPDCGVSAKHVRLGEEGQYVDTRAPATPALLPGCSAAAQRKRMIEQIDRVFEQFGSAAVFSAKQAMLEKDITFTSLYEAFWRAARSVRSKLEEQIQRRRAEFPAGLEGMTLLSAKCISHCLLSVVVPPKFSRTKGEC
ncbi:hypothetical protein ERJ75_000401900 [Trypanosoma vivax]|nr:hypothetical protein ERJ75_000401900 [Trypanosoma vivax]